MVAGGAALADMSGGLLPVPSETIPRGAPITAEKLTEKHFYYDPDRPLSVLTDPREAIGRAARRTLVAGKPIPFDAVRRISLVKRGKPTEARFAVGNLTITTTVLPEADGGPGALVRARNPGSGRIISGVVSEDGRIEVAPQ
jgi:flagella basal body P-ring formation protein FlgA